MSFIQIFMVISCVSLLLNVLTIAGIFLLTRQYAEKIALLSHVAGHYLNSVEQQDTAKKLNTTSVAINKSVTKSFLKRGAR
jgi:biopolymer transport protein ExbB/TolQ